MTGQMMRVFTQIQPDVAFDVGQMSNTGKFPKVKLLFEARTGSITFLQLERPSNLNIACYATNASLEDGSSQGGFILFVCGTT